MRRQTMEEYVVERQAARVKTMALPVPRLARTKAYTPPVIERKEVNHRTAGASRERHTEPPSDLVTTRGTARVYKLWTDAEREEMARLHDGGATWQKIAEKYGVSAHAAYDATKRRKGK
jgi:hypothetical protein